MLPWPSLCNQREGWLCSSGFGSKNLAEKAAPTVPVRIQGKHSFFVSSTFWYGTHYDGSPVGTAIPAPFNSIISWVTSPLDYKEAQVPPASQEQGCLEQCCRKASAFCDSSGALAAVSHQLTESFHETAPRGSQGTGVLCGDCSFVLPGKGNIVWGHAWLRKESLTLGQCLISLSLYFPSINHFLWCLVAGQG